MTKIYRAKFTTPAGLFTAKFIRRNYNKWSMQFNGLKTRLIPIPNKDAIELYTTNGNLSGTFKDEIVTLPKQRK